MSACERTSLPPVRLRASQGRPVPSRRLFGFLFVWQTKKNARPARASYSLRLELLRLDYRVLRLKFQKVGYYVCNCVSKLGLLVLRQQMFLNGLRLHIF